MFLWDNVEKYCRGGRPQITWRMRIACWKPKATNTHIGCVILVVFHYNNGWTNAPQMLRYTFIAYLVFSDNISDSTHQLSTTSQLLNPYTFRPAHIKITDTEWHTPEAVLIQLILLMMSTRLFETCRAAFLKLFFKWGPLSLVRMFYGPPYSWDYQTH